MKKYTWARKSDNGYEVSSKGDKRFSAYYAKLGSTGSIEYHYQVTIKGYNSISEGKGKPPLNDITPEEQWYCYKLLWKIFFISNMCLLKEIAVLSENKVLTDMFATSDINQARAISEILNEYFENGEKLYE